MTGSKTGRVYDEKVRRQAVRILESGAGHRALASKLGIPEATARQWARSYAVGGSSAVMNAGSSHHVYSYELKLEATKDRVENGLTVREVMVKYGIPSESSVKTWCRLYREKGPEALVNKPRGVKPREVREQLAAEETAKAVEETAALDAAEAAALAEAAVRTADDTAAVEKDATSTAPAPER